MEMEQQVSLCESDVLQDLSPHLKTMVSNEGPEEVKDEKEMNNDPNGLNNSSDCMRNKEHNLPEESTSSVVEQEEAENCDLEHQSRLTAGLLPLSKYVVKNISENVEPTTLSCVSNVHTEPPDNSIQFQECLENRCIGSVVQSKDESLDMSPSKRVDVREMFIDSYTSQKSGKSSRAKIEKRKGVRIKEISRPKREVTSKDGEVSKSVKFEERENIAVEKSETQEHVQSHSEQGMTETRKYHGSEKQGLQILKSPVSCKLENMEDTRCMKCWEEDRDEVNDHKTIVDGNEACGAEVRGMHASEPHEKVHNIGTSTEVSVSVQASTACVENLCESNDCKDLLKTSEEMGFDAKMESGFARFPEGQLELFSDETNPLGQEASQHSTAVNVHTKFQCNDIPVVGEQNGELCMESEQKQKGKTTKKETMKNDEQDQILLGNKATRVQDMPVRELRDRRRKKYFPCEDFKESTEVKKGNSQLNRRSKDLAESKCTESKSDHVVKDSCDSGKELAFSKVTAIDDSENVDETDYTKPQTRARHGELIGTEDIHKESRKYYCTRLSETTRRESVSRRKKSTVNRKKKVKRSGMEESELSLTPRGLENNVNVLHESGSSVVEPDPEEQDVILNQSVTESELPCDQPENDSNSEKPQRYVKAPVCNIFQGTSETVCSKLHRVVNDRENLNERNVDSLSLHIRGEKNTAVDSTVDSVTKEIGDMILESTSPNRGNENQFRKHKCIENTAAEKVPILEEQKLEYSDNHDSGTQNDLNCLNKVFSRCESTTLIKTCEVLQKVVVWEETSLESKIQNYEISEKYPPKAGQTVLEKNSLEQENTYSGDQTVECVKAHKAVQVRRGRCKRSRQRRKKKPYSKDTLNSVEIKEVFLKASDSLGSHSHLTVEDTEKYQSVESRKIEGNVTCLNSEVYSPAGRIKDERTYQDTEISDSAKIREGGQQKGDQMGKQINYEGRPQFSKHVQSHELENVGKGCYKKEKNWEGNMKCEVTSGTPVEKVQSSNVATLSNEYPVYEEIKSDATCSKNSGTCKDSKCGTDSKYAESGIVVCKGSDSVVLKQAKMTVECPENCDTEDQVCKKFLTECNMAKSGNFEGPNTSECETVEVNPDECKREILPKCTGKHSHEIDKDSCKECECQIVWESSTVQPQGKPNFKTFEDGTKERNFTCDKEINEKGRTVTKGGKGLLIEKAVSPEKLVTKNFGCSKKGMDCKECLLNLKHETDEPDYQEHENLHDLKFCNTVNASEQSVESRKTSEGSITCLNSEVCSPAGQIKDERAYQDTEIRDLAKIIEGDGSVCNESDCMILEQNQEIDHTEDVCRSDEISSKHDLVQHVKTEVFLDYEPEDPSESKNNFEGSEILKCVDVEMDLSVDGCANEECQIVWESSRAHCQQISDVGIVDSSEIPDKKIKRRREREKITELMTRAISDKSREKICENTMLRKTEMEENAKCGADHIVERKQIPVESSKSDPWPGLENELQKVHTTQVKEHKLQFCNDEGNCEFHIIRNTNEKFSELSKCQVVESLKEGTKDVKNEGQLSQGIKTNLGSFKVPSVLVQTCHSVPKHVEQTVCWKNSNLKLECSLASGSPKCRTDYLKKSIAYEVTEPLEECDSRTKIQDCETDHLNNSLVLYEGMEQADGCDTCFAPQEDSILRADYHYNKYVESRQQNDVGSQTVSSGECMQLTEHHQLMHHKMGCETCMGYQLVQFIECDKENNQSTKGSDDLEKQKFFIGSSVKHCVAVSEDATGSLCQLNKKDSKDSNEADTAISHEQDTGCSVKTTEEIVCSMNDVAAEKQYNVPDQWSNEQQCGSDFGELPVDEVEALSWEEKQLLEIWPEEDTEEQNESGERVARYEVKDLKKILPKDKNYTKVTNTANVRSHAPNGNAVGLTQTCTKIQLKRKNPENDSADKTDRLNNRFEILLEEATSNMRGISSNPDNTRHPGFPYGRKYYDPYHYSRFSDRNTRFTGGLLRSESPISSEIWTNSTFWESGVPRTMENEHPVKRQADAIKAAELQKTLKELEHQIEKIEAKKSLGCKHKDTEQSQKNKGYSQVKYWKSEDKSTSFGNKQSLENSSLGNLVQVDLKSSVDYTRWVSDDLEFPGKCEQKSLKTKMGLPRCGNKAIITREGENVEHPEFTVGQSNKFKSYELSQQFSENELLQRHRVSGKVTNTDKKPGKSKQSENELRLLQYLRVEEESDHEAEPPDNSKANSSPHKKLKQEADNTSKNKVTKYQCGNLTCIVPDENIGSGDAVEKKCQYAEANSIRESTSTEPAGTLRGHKCDHPRKEDGEISSESENSGACNKPFQVQGNLESAKVTKAPYRNSDAGLKWESEYIEKINKMNSCGGSSRSTSHSAFSKYGSVSGGSKYKSNHNTQQNWRSYVKDMTFQEKNAITKKYKTCSKPYSFSRESKHGIVSRELNKRDDFTSVSEKGKFYKSQFMSVDRLAGSKRERELEHGEYGQTGLDKYSDTQQRFKKLPNRYCDCDDHNTANEPKVEFEERRIHFHRDKQKLSTQELVRQLEVISSLVEGKQNKNLRQKESHPSAGKVMEKKHKECPEKFGKAEHGSSIVHRLDLLGRLKAIMDEWDKKAVAASQSPSPVKKSRCFKSVKRSPSPARSDDDGWTRKPCRSHKEKSVEKKGRSGLSKEYLSRYCSKSSSSKLFHGVPAVGNDEDLEYSDSYRGLPARGYKGGHCLSTSGGIEGKNHGKRVLTDGGQVLKKLKQDLTETNECQVRSGKQTKHGMVISKQKLSELCCEKMFSSEDECSSTKKLKYCKHPKLKKPKKREAEQSPTSSNIMHKAKDKQICPERKVKSFHAHNKTEQSLKASRGGSTRGDDKRSSKDVDTAKKRLLENAKEASGSRESYLSPEKMLKLLLHGNTEDSSSDRDSGSTSMINKESLPKHKSKASTDSPKKKSGMPSSKHGKSAAHGVSSVIEEDETEIEKKKNLEDIKDGNVDESCEILKNYWDSFTA